MMSVRTFNRGSVRLKFTWTEALKSSKKTDDTEKAGKYLAFDVRLAGVRGEIGTFYTPRHKLQVLGRTFWQSTCRYCRQPPKKHTVEGRCERY